MKKNIINDNNKIQAELFFSNLCFEKGQYTEALLHYINLLDKATFKTTIFSNIAFTYEKLGNYKLSLHYAKESLRFGRSEYTLNHTIDPEENVKELIQRLESII